MKVSSERLTSAAHAGFMDEDLTFYMQTYVDASHGFYTAGRVRSFYPGARVVVRSDGGGRAAHRWSEVGAEMYNEERLFPINHGGRVVQRMLDLYADRPTPYLIKIDPDTVFHRRFLYLPTEDGLFGTVQGGRSTRSIQGGFIGIARGTALAIRESKLLLDPMLRAPSSQLGPYMALLERRASRCGLSSFDCLLGWAASRLGRRIFTFREIRSNWKTPPENRKCRFAVTHPAPNWGSWERSSREALVDREEH
jgi:hypothetical protein